MIDYSKPITKYRAPSIHVIESDYYPQYHAKLIKPVENLIVGDIYKIKHGTIDNKQHLVIETMNGEWQFFHHNRIYVTDDDIIYIPLKQIMRIKKLNRIIENENL